MWSKKCASRQIAKASGFPRLLRVLFANVEKDSRSSTQKMIK